LKPDFALSHHNLGDVLVKKEDWEGAIAAYQKAIELDPSFAWSYYNLGESFTQLEQWEDGIKYYRKAIELQADLPRVTEKLGDALQKQIRLYSEAAITVYHQVIEKEPDDIKVYHKALEIKQDSPELYLGLSHALERQGEKEQAIVFRDLAWHQFSQKKVAHRPNRPTFSIVIPIYDRTQLLYETLVSLCNQTYQNFEVILVLDGSPLETRSVVEKFNQDSRFRVFSYPEASGNACRGRNRGIIEAQGEYIALTDSDDISTPDRLEITLNTFEDNNCDAVVGKARYIIDDGRKNSPVKMLSENEVIPLIYPILKRVNPIVTSTISIRRDVLLKYGGFRPEMRYREDHELWLRLSFNGCKMIFVDHLFALYRLHESNNELNFKEEDSNWVQMMHHYYSQPLTNWGI
jgi:tetratricopeptide (TPR) repeat protein